MGAERWIAFSTPEEKKRAQAYFGGLGEIGVEGEYGCWLGWSKRGRLEVGYSFGGFSDEWATLICREIARRFDVVKIGHDAVGWYKDSEMEGEDPKYTTWVEWLRDYTPFGRQLMLARRLSSPSREAYQQELLEQGSEMEPQIAEVFAKLDSHRNENRRGS